MLHASATRFDVTGNLENFCPGLASPVSSRQERVMTGSSVLQLGSLDRFLA